MAASTTSGALKVRPLNARRRRRRPAGWAVVALGRVVMLLLAVSVSLTNLERLRWTLPAAAALAVIATAAMTLGERAAFVTVLEAVGVATLAGWSTPDVALLPYLLVPCFAAGLTGGLSLAVPAALATLAGLGLGAQLNEQVQLATELSVQWTTLCAAAGLVGAWTNRQRTSPTEDSARYGAAARLLTQLQDVSRRLSGGLDHVAIAESLLSDVREAVGADHGVVLRISAGNDIVPLATTTSSDEWLSSVENDRVTRDAVALRRTRATPLATGTVRTYVPLTVDARPIGLVVVEGASSPDRNVLSDVDRRSEEAALRLDTALLFAEIREDATVEERRRLAREIHDGIAQELASVGYLADDLASGALPPADQATAKALRDAVRRIVSDLRMSIYDLRTQIDDQASLGSAISEHARRLGARERLQVHLVLDESLRRLRPEVEAELLRITQEAMTNVRKHAEARTMWVQVEVDPPHAKVVVSDDGKGLGPKGSQSYGMEIMAERATRAGAALTVSNRPEGGTVVTVEIS